MISIIIPVYNAEKYIISCLNSIKNQDVELEVICVNDGSTDMSEKIIKEFASTNKFVKYLYQKNAGAPAARNNGLEIASGNYVMFFDADDILLPNALKYMVREMENNLVDIVIGNYNEINEQGEILREINQEDYISNIKEHWKFAQCPPLPGNKLIRRSLLENSNIKFETLKIGQDLNFYLKLLTDAKKITLVNQCVMGYRIVDGSISRQYSLKILDICNSIDNVKKFYKEKRLSLEYEKYISITELIAYRSQLEKVMYFDNEIDARKTCNILGKRVKQCKIHNIRLLKKYVKEKVKCFLILVRCL